VVFLGRDGNRGCQLVGLAVKDVGTENCRVTVAAVEGHSKESKESGSKQQLQQLFGRNCQIAVGQA